MSLVVVGLNHRHAALDQLERLAVSAERMPKALLSLRQRQHVGEVVVLSTCNRVEIYARVHRFHGGVSDVRHFLCEWGGFAPEDLVDLLYEYHDERAVEHLFAVTCGLDSVVVGEKQVARQVKQAYLDAEREGACGVELAGVFQRALRVARQVRTTTNLAHAAATMLDAGLDATREAVGPISAATVLLLGAGKIGALASRRLVDRAGVTLVVNRTFDRAQRLAAHGGTALLMERLDDALASADLVIASTAAHEALITPDRLRPIMARRPGRRLVLLDLAVPRDVAPACREITGVEVLDVDAIAASVASRPAAVEVERARALVSGEVAAYVAWQRARRAEPTIAALRRHAERIRVDEFDRLAPRLGDLDDRQRAAVEQLSRGIINTLLHEPTVRLKQASSGEDGRWQAEVVRDLFALDDPAVGALDESESGLHDPAVGARDDATGSAPCA